MVKLLKDENGLYKILQMRQNKYMVMSSLKIINNLANLKTKE
jgi:hypothetical protein